MVMIQQRSTIRTRYCNIYRLFLLSFGGIILLIIFRQRTTHKIIKDTLHTKHQHNMEKDIKEDASSSHQYNMENDMEEDVILPTVSYSLSAIVRTKKEGSNSSKLEYALVHDKVDAAARKRAEEKAARKEHQSYTLVHENPPRGWWLPGGGVEHRDITPVDGAIREALEEAGSPSLSHLLPLFTTTKTNEDIKEDELQLLPTMSHLLSLEQSSGRQRFIFRGEWIDDDNDYADDSSTHNCNILKCSPGDDESEEAQWVTLDEVTQIATRQRGDTTQVESESTFLQQMRDPWLRGHEPVTFFGLLENAWQQNEVVPGLPVYKINLSGNDVKEEEEEEVTGAFFGRHTLDEEPQLVYHGSRSALLTHLKCSLLVYDKSQQTVAIDKATNTFPSSFVSDQNEMSLKKLVDGMISYYNPSHPSADNDASVGLLRVQHIIHDNGREATLTVYPYIILPDTIAGADEEINWVPIDELSVSLERRLAEVVMDDNQMKEKYLSLDVLRDKESARRYTTHV